MATYITDTTSDKDEFRFAIISDRGKGLDPAIAKFFPEPYAFHYYCTQHLAENVKERFSTEIESLFRQLMQVPTISEHASIISKIFEISAAAVTYIDGIGDRSHYCKAYAPLFDYPRYGHTTSNIGESMNSRLREERKLTPLYCLEAIWIKQMNLVYSRYTAPQNDEVFYGEELTKFAT